MQIHELEALGRAPATGDKLVIDTGELTAKIDYDALATAIISNLGGDPVAIAHGGTGATSAGDARTNLDVRCRIFNSVSQLGLTSGSVTILQAFNALGDNAALFAQNGDFASGACPGNGVVVIIRKGDARAFVAFYGKGSMNQGDWRMFEGGTAYNGYTNNAPDGVWHPELAGCRGGTGSSGTTLQIMLPSNSSHLLTLFGNGTERYWHGLLFVNSAGAVTAIEIKKGTGATIATATNKVTLTASSGTELAFMCIPIRGGKFNDYVIS